MIVGTIVITLVVVVIGVMLDRRFGLLRAAEVETTKPPIVHPVGDSPATALRAGAVQLGRLRSAQRCRSCRAAMQDEPGGRVQFDGRDLLVLSFRCPRCAARRAMYVEGL